MINALHALVLGIVEGFTEFLPISSTAHLIIVSRLLGIAQSDYAKTFEIAIQSGAILAVVVLYWRRFLDWEVLKRIVIAFVPTGVLGLVFYKLAKSHLLGNMGAILWALGLGGLFLIIFERLPKSDDDERADIKNVSVGRLIGIGVFQAVAMIPGISRSAATIAGGMILGMKRAAIVEFSFLLATPTLLAATGLELLKSYRDFSSGQLLSLGIGFVVSFATAIVSIRFLLRYIKKRSLAAFGIYRIILVLTILAFGFAKYGL